VIHRVRVPNVAIIIAMGMCVMSAPARAQGGLLLQGIVDLEGWSTDTASNLLTRNRGSAGDVFRGQLWGAVEPWRGVFLFAQSQVEGGNARPFGERYTEAALDQAGLRVARDPRFVLNVGKLFHPVGTFASRSFSTRNPLIGTPDGYSAVYPLGAILSGELQRIDYRAGVVSLPLTHRGYQPYAAAAAHPVIGAGFTPLTGLRFAATATDGPYLNNDFTSSQLQGRSWTSYRLRQLESDLQYGIGHFDLRAEQTWSSYDVPGQNAAGGSTGYAETRYTVTPRVFVAARGELSNYPFIRPINQTSWVARSNKFRDWEAGVGLRATESTLVKLSYRADRWTVTPANYTFIRPGGHAVAVQLSQAFDVMNWLPAAR
jgi:hypothetical protein